jgi:hypothetical protein
VDNSTYINPILLMQAEELWKGEADFAELYPPIGHKITNWDFIEWDTPSANRPEEHQPPHTTSDLSNEIENERIQNGLGWEDEEWMMSDVDNEANFWGEENGFGKKKNSGKKKNKNIMRKMGNVH